MHSKIAQKDINSFCVKATEPIKEHYLSEFISYSFQKKNIHYKSAYKVFCTYLKYSNEYQISYFESPLKNPLLSLECIPFEKNENCLIISTDFFVLFIQGTLYYHQNLTQELTREEIEHYVRRRLKIEQFKTSVVETMDEIKYYDIQYIQQNNYYHTVFVSFYILLCIVAGILMYYQSNNSNVLSQIMVKKYSNEYHTLKQESKFESTLFQDYKTIRNELEVYHITLDSFKYHSKYYELTLQAIEKKALLDLLNKSSFNYMNSHIEFDSVGKQYVLHAQINAY